MKITKELQHKLNSEQEKRQDTLLEPLRKAQNEIVAQIKQEQIKTFEKILEDYPIVQKLLNFINSRYGLRYDSSHTDVPLDYFIDHYYDKVCTPEQTKLLDEINNKITEQNLQCIHEFERILIEISYGKNINDIKNVFQKYGLDF